MDDKNKTLTEGDTKTLVKEQSLSVRPSSPPPAPKGPHCDNCEKIKEATKQLDLAAWKLKNQDSTIKEIFKLKKELQRLHRILRQNNIEVIL